MDFLTFAANNHWPAFLLVFMIGWTLTSLSNNLIFRPFNRYMRHKNIAAQGWPPAHLDADGDFKPEPEEK